MKFTVYCDLKQFEKAIETVAQFGDKYFSEAMVIVKKQRLYKQAMNLYYANNDLV